MTAKVLPMVREYDPVKAGARCDLCPLQGNTVVPPKASPLPPKIVFVGEAPGRKEEIQGQPFVGQTGQFLRSLCREVDIDFLEASLQNAALCRSNLDKENEAAAAYCAPRLLRELAGFGPTVPIVTLGKASTLSVLGVRSIMHARGFVWTAREIDPTPAWRAAKRAKERGAPKAPELWLKAQIAEGRSKLAGRTVMPTVHPAFVLRADIWLPILKLDLDRVGRWLRGELTHETLLDNGPYVVASKRDDVRRELRKLKNVIAADIETAPSKPGGKDGADPNRNRMLCIGLSDGDHTVVIWPWRKTHAPLVNALFRRVKRIGMHNGYNFDQISLARHGVPFEPIEDKLEDTLIGHHTFSSNMPQRLSHVASVFVDAGPWKITFKRGKDGASEKGLPYRRRPRSTRRPA
jgi:DNA polymerase